MLVSSFRPVELNTDLVEFKPPIPGVFRAFVAMRPFLFGRHREEGAGNFQITAEHFQGVHAADRGGNRQAHRITNRFFRRDDFPFHCVGRSVEAFHPNRRNPALDEDRKHFSLEATEAGVKARKWQLKRVELKTVIQYFQVKVRRLVAGESNFAGGECAHKKAVGESLWVRLICFEVTLFVSFGSPTQRLACHMAASLSTATSFPSWARAKNSAEFCPAFC